MKVVQVEQPLGPIFGALSPPSAAGQVSAATAEKWPTIAVVASLPETLTRAVALGGTARQAESFRVNAAPLMHG